MSFRDNRRGGGSRGGRSGGGRPQPKAVDQVRAPYTFVPMSDAVVDAASCPALQAQAVTQDVPFSDGVSGTLSVRVTPHGPVAMRGRQTGDRGQGGKPVARFAVWPDTGEPLLPGSSVRGLLRNTVEIASFARLRRVNDRRYGVRDLHNRDLYGQHMAGLVKVRGTNKPMPFVSAGWLTRNTGENQKDVPALLQPCSFAKVHYKFLDAIAKALNNTRFNPGQKQSAPDKYRAWGDDPRSFTFQIDTLIEQNRPPRNAPPRLGDFGIVTRLGGPGARPGTLVFTGQPQRYDPNAARRPGAGHPKQHDFVFYDSDGPRPPQLEVSRKAFDDFVFIHSQGGEQHRLTDNANDELKHWLRATKWESDAPQGRIPVFFLLEPGSGTRIRALGLAMMFRLAYKMSVGEAIAAHQGPDEGHLDLSDLLFGHVPLKEGAGDGSAQHRGLKGRVSVGHGRPEGRLVEGRVVKAVLGTPKASYYPNYVEQGDPENLPGANAPRGRDGKPAFRTWMDDKKGHEARPRGWKRYRPLQQIQRPVLPTDAQGRPLENDKVVTRFQPLEPEPGAGFALTLRVHNLRPFELGALLWALDFGGDATCFHTLGLAKSLGYGKVQLSLTDSQLVANDPDAAPPSLDACRQAYAAFMEAALDHCARTGTVVRGGWSGSRQIFELRAAARLAESDSDHRHMQLSHPDFRNEFQSAKMQGLALRAAGDSSAWQASVKDWSAPARRAVVPPPAAAPAREAAAAPAAPEAEAPEGSATERAYAEAFRLSQHWKLLETWAAEPDHADAQERLETAWAKVTEAFPKRGKRKKKADRYPAVFAWFAAAGKE